MWVLYIYGNVQAAGEPLKQKVGLSGPLDRLHRQRRRDFHRFWIYGEVATGGKDRGGNSLCVPWCLGGYCRFGAIVCVSRGPGTVN